MCIRGLDPSWTEEQKDNYNTIRSAFIAVLGSQSAVYASQNSYDNTKPIPNDPDESLEIAFEYRQFDKLCHDDPHWLGSLNLTDGYKAELGVVHEYKNLVQGVIKRMKAYKRYIPKEI